MEELRNMIIELGIQPTATNAIYGQYPGLLRIEEIERAEDYALYIYLAQCKYIVEGVFGAVKNGYKISIDKEDIYNICYEAELLIYTICVKNDIYVSEPTLGEHIEFDTTLLTQWFRFNHNHFTVILNDIEWTMFNWNHQHGKNVSKFLPKGNWREWIG